MGRVLCFRAVLTNENGDEATSLLPKDGPDLAILVYLLSECSDGDVLHTSGNLREKYAQKTASDASIWKDKKIIQKYSTALEIAHSNYILLTSEGTLALGPPNTRVGDQTSIISGGLCPYILRRNTKTQHLERAAFDLVEDCVLDRTPPREPEELETVFLV
ncbi:hypothetical protein NW765_005289 [Fusarium oxysporum]|uniref:Uncharacterized protein n=1 Tax=Fusarium oxysporum Fo47 TaxID=660027 RepID=W9L238_FUSOX|nr:hypothetical protein FOZG_03955 [Fusarium oxysporum Fo47]KAJ4122457.1 hypothetical protein NW765_005289 [Fusarium oxysporum]